MSDTSSEVEEVGMLELEEGDVAMVIRGTGEVEFLLLNEDETSEDFHKSLRMIEYMKFALGSRDCLSLFEETLKKTFN
jgi:hypothetical protein